MTYHDALINQLSGLVQKVEKLRSCLQETDKNVYKVCALQNRQRYERCLVVCSHSSNALEQFNDCFHFEPVSFLNDQAMLRLEIHRYIKQSSMIGYIFKY